MIDIENKRCQPTVDELCEYVGNSLFDEICGYMKSEYQALFNIEFSGDKILYGWNLKIRKAGRTLCTVYPRKNHFYMLLIVGQKEKAQVEKLLPEFSPDFRSIYKATKEGMGQRWMIFDMNLHNDLYEDALTVIKIRRGK